MDIIGGGGLIIQPTTLDNDLLVLLSNTHNTTRSGHWMKRAGHASWYSGIEASFHMTFSPVFLKNVFIYFSLERGGRREKERETAM